MRVITTAIIAALAAGLPALPAAARDNARYEYRGKQYSSLQQCLASQRRAKQRGTVVGAATAGIGAALLGGNLAESALVAGGGAVVGHEIARKTHDCRRIRR